jgi:hypothetical protein
LAARRYFNHASVMLCPKPDLDVVGKSLFPDNVRRSFNLGDKYLFPDEVSFYRHLMLSFTEPVPLCFVIQDLEGYLAEQEELKGGPAGMFKWQPDQPGCQTC